MRPAELIREKVQAKYPGATIVQRHRNSILHRHPTDPNRFILDSEGPLHYGLNNDQEIDTEWKVSDGNWDYEVTANDFHCYVRDSVPVSYRYEDVATGHYVELTWSAVEWVNDEGDSEPVVQFQQVAPTITDGKITWSEIASGWDVTVNAQPTRLAKLVGIDSLANLGTPTIGGTNIALCFRLTFTKSSGLEIWSSGEKWSEKNNTWIETMEDLEFKDVDTQESIFWFKKPWAFDGGDDFASVIQRTKRTGVNFYAEVDIPWSWLNNPDIYPIVIDPTVDAQTGASGDDGEVGDEGSINTGNSYIRLGSASGENWSIFARFTGITISGTISTAYIELRSRGSYGDLNVYSDISADDSASPSAPTTSTEFDNITRTAAVISVTDWGTWVNNGWIGSELAELKTVIQELVDSYTYSDGAIQILIDDASSSQWYSASAYDEDSAYGPKLHIEYSTSSSHDLTANSIKTTLELGTPVIGQTHILTANGIKTTPELGTPTVGQSVNLTAVDVKTTPELGRPAIGQTHILTANGVKTTLEVGLPTIGQTHILTANGVKTTLEVGLPTIGQTHVLTANGLTAPFVVGVPIIGQTHALTPTGLVVNPVVGVPTIGQSHALIAQSILSTPVVGVPLIGQTHILTAVGIKTTPVLGAPSMIPSADLTAVGIKTTPILGAPLIGQTHILTALGVDSTPVLDAPLIGQTHILTALGVDSTFVVDTPLLGQTHILTALGVLTTPVLGTPILETSITHALTALGIISTPVVETPTIGQIHTLSAIGIKTSSVVGSPWLDVALVDGIIETIFTVVYLDVVKTVYQPKAQIRAYTEE